MAKKDDHLDNPVAVLREKFYEKKRNRKASRLFEEIFQEKELFRKKDDPLQDDKSRKKISRPKPRDVDF